jgi:hypothetical protein
MPIHCAGPVLKLNEAQVRAARVRNLMCLPPISVDDLRSYANARTNQRMRIDAPQSWPSDDRHALHA